MNILIPNATSPKNVGDQAMLQVLVDLIKSVHKNAFLTVHSADPNLDKGETFNVKHTLYSWSVFREKKTIARVINILKLVTQYLVLKAGVDSLKSDKKLDHIIRDYRNADLILFVGGGYLRSRKGIKQSLNLFMQLYLFRYAALFSAKKIVAPISVGPFGYKWHEKIVVHVLKQMDLVAIREEISYKMLKKHKMKNVVLCSDHAFMTRKIIKKFTRGKSTIGFTIRKWLSGNSYTKFEKSFIDSIQQFSQLTGARVQPIVQVDAPMYGDDDVLLTKKIIKKLKNNDVDVLKMKSVNTVQGALEAYAAIDLLLGMRMHSNILAAVQGVPFVAISYEHKTEGIAKQLGMEKYCIKSENLDKKNLYPLLRDAYKKRRYLKHKLLSTINTIQNAEIQKWHSFLSI